VGTEDVLAQIRKECVLLVNAAANLNTYCVAAHCETLRLLGMPPDESDQIAVDHHQADLSEADKALLDFALRLGAWPAEFGREDIHRLQAHGFTGEQILESVVVTAFGNFLTTLTAGLGTIPDFEPKRVFTAKEMQLSEPPARLTGEANVAVDHTIAGVDPDAGLVARVQEGAVEAFEELVRRHSRRVYRTMLGILADAEEAQDGMQDTFLKAFEHVGELRGRSKFAAWLLTIARNTALQRLRERENVQSLDEGGFEEEEFHPRLVRAWHGNPEQLYSETERRELVEKAVMRLPSKYRIVVMLRDIEQLSTDGVAAALGLNVPALKARLFRGRLMLRESLSPHFTARAGRRACD
jgi:RNA polymerase sigma-70 factor (ECF subfamily)